MSQYARAFLLMMGLLAGTAQAATCTSVQSGNWNSSTTWSCTGGVTRPGGGDDVIIVSPHTVTLNNSYSVTNLTIQAGATLNDGNNRRLTVSGSVVIDGTYDGTGNGGRLIMIGNGQTLSGTGTIIDIGRIQIDANITIPASSNLDLTLRSEIRVGNNNPATLTIDGTITGTSQTNGNRILRAENNNTSTVIINGTFNAPNSFVEVQAGGTVTNNGTVSLQNLDGDNAATATWTQGANANLTMTQPMAAWSGTFNASASNNTVTFDGTATPLDPMTYFNLAGTNVTCPLAAGITVLGSSPCGPPTGGTVTGSPTLCVNDVTIGTQPWSGLGNVGAQDNIYAQSSGRNGQITNYLKCTGYGFNIPAGATINGITVGVWDWSRRTMRDQSMVLVKADVVQTAPPATRDLATQTRFARNNTEVVYGGATNLWGNTWTPAEINSPTFGAAFAAIRGPYNTTDTAYVDYMSIAVDYTLPVQPVATYHMDEASWNGTVNEVVDSSGSGNNGQAFNNASTDGTTPAIASSPGTCRYGVFDNGGTITQGYVQTPLTNFITDFTISAWIRTTNNAVSGQRILIDDQNNTGGYGFSLADSGTAGRLRFFSRGISPISLDSTYTIANNTWYFVAAVADITNRRRTIYVFDAAGALLNSTTEAAWTGGAWGVDAGPVSIGAETNASGESNASFHFRGNLDEVQVFNSALTQSQLAQIATQTHACASNIPDHLEVHSVGTGVTCTPNTLTVVACADAACSTLYTLGVSGTLSAAGTPTVNWDGTTGGAAGAGFVIPAGASSVTKNVQVTTPGSVVFGISSANPVPTNATTCNFGTPSCTFTAADSGFLVSAPNHVSETLSALTVQAVRKSDNSLVCVPAFTVPKTVNLRCTYVDPASGTFSVRVGGAALNAGNNAAAACDGNGGDISLNFDASGIATSSLQYADVGNIQIDASFTGAAGSEDEGLNMTGSGTFITVPASFAFSAITPAPIRAGNLFGATVTAMNSLGNPTPNFGGEIAPESVVLSFTKCQPTGTNSSNGAFSGNVGAFTTGVASANNLNWSEVGNGDLVATNSNYLASGLASTGNTGTGSIECNSSGAGNIGPFIPDHFDTVVSGPMTCPGGLTCPAGGLVYSGQAFTANISAMNASGALTQNYDGTANTSPNFAKTVTLTAWDALGSTTTQNPPAAAPGSISGGSDTVAATSFSMGTTLFPGVPAAPIYTFGTIPTTPTDIYIRAQDTDNVTSLGAINPTTTSVEGGVKVVSGRVKVSNAYGSELLPLTLVAAAQYYTANGWGGSITDGITSMTLAGSAVVGSGTTTVSPTNGTLVAGKLNINLSTPVPAGSAGVATITPAIDACPLPATCYLPVIPGTATFGIYSNNNNFIYRRER